MEEEDSHVNAPLIDSQRDETSFKISEQETHQNHVTGGDVHVGVGGLLAPGRDAAPRRRADGLTAAIAELRRHAVDPGGDRLRALGRRFDRHPLPAELLQEEGRQSGRGGG